MTYLMHTTAAAALVLGAVTLAALPVGPLAAPAQAQENGQAEGAREAPQFEVDPSWPQPLPDNMILGQVAGIDIGPEGNIWLVQRPGSLSESERGAALDPPRSDCCVPAPPVMEFTPEGDYVQGWGGPDEGGEYEWPANEHGILVDDNGNVWLAGNGEEDAQILKFSGDGTFLMQIGSQGESGGNTDTENLGRPADIEVDLDAQEVYVADGYGNHRVIVFDSESGEYKRHWGAYGDKPSDEDEAEGDYDPSAEPASDFRSPVHCVRIADDGMVYVCDRVNNRIQVFEKDGTYVDEFIFNEDTLGNGSIWDLDFSIDDEQRYMFNADGENNQVQTIERESGEMLGHFGRSGRYAGQFHWVHNLVVDDEGNIYTAEVDTAKRAQKFTPVGQ